MYAVKDYKAVVAKTTGNFEEARNLNAVVFDKTKTLTKGAFGVIDIISNQGIDEFK